MKAVFTGVQRVPDTETQGRVHTSAATVAVMPEAEELDVKIEEKDLRIDVFRSSGPETKRKYHRLSGQNYSYSLLVQLSVNKMKNRR